MVTPQMEAVRMHEPFTVFDMRAGEPRMGDELGPPDFWQSRWDEVSAGTGFSLDDTMDIGLIDQEWKGHPRGSIIIRNFTQKKFALLKPPEDLTRGLILQPRGEGSEQEYTHEHRWLISFTPESFRNLLQNVHQDLHALASDMTRAVLDLMDASAKRQGDPGVSPAMRAAVFRQLQKEQEDVVHRYMEELTDSVHLPEGVEIEFGHRDPDQAQER